MRVTTGPTLALANYRPLDEGGHTQAGAHTEGWSGSAQSKKREPLGNSSPSSYELGTTEWGTGETRGGQRNSGLVRSRQRRWDGISCGSVGNWKTFRYPTAPSCSCQMSAALASWYVQTQGIISYLSSLQHTESCYASDTHFIAFKWLFSPIMTVPKVCPRKWWTQIVWGR